MRFLELPLVDCEMQYSQRLWNFCHETINRNSSLSRHFRYLVKLFIRIFKSGGSCCWMTLVSACTSDICSVEIRISKLSRQCVALYSHQFIVNFQNDRLPRFGYGIYIYILDISDLESSTCLGAAAWRHIPLLIYTFGYISWLKSILLWICWYGTCISNWSIVLYDCICSKIDHGWSMSVYVVSTGLYSRQ